MFHGVSAGWFVLVGLLTGGSDPLPVVRELPLEAVYQAEAPIVIQTGDEPARFEIKLPSIEPKDGLLCLRFEAYLKTPRPAGWNPYLGIVVNGRPLSASTRSGHLRLLKRGTIFETTLGPKPLWGGRAGMPTLNTVFCPGSSDLDPRILTDRDEGCWYLLDISDVAHFIRRGADERIESAEPNQIVFVNTFVKRLVPGRKSYPPMVIDHLTVGYLPKRWADRLRRAQMETYEPVSTGPTLTGPDFQLRVAPSGGMQLSVGEERYFFAAALSYPAEPKMRFNTLTPEKAAGQPGWKPRVERAADGTIRVTARAAAYQIERCVQVDGFRVRVRDTIRNRSAEPIGLVIRNTLALDRLPADPTWRLAGTDRESIIGGAAANPTVFAAQKKSSVGIVAEDNVFRLQLELLRRYNAFDFQTTHFGLDAGKSYTLEWTIYPLRSLGYFDFVNRVRRDWGVNYKVEGPFAFDDEAVAGRAVKIYVFGPWLDYHHDGSQTRESYARRVRPMLQRLKKAQPDAVFMPKLESNLFTMVKSRIPDGELLPGSDRKAGRYGHFLTKEQSAVLDKALGPWRDSVLRTEDGRIIVDTYYPGYLPNKADLFNLLVYVRDGNYRYRLFLDQIDFAMDQIGFNGVYIDQFSQEGGFYRRDRFTYDGWDGHTVDLDSQGRIQRKRTDCNLVGATARAKILKHILSKGGRVVTNGQSTVRETRGLPVYAFQEMENDPVNPLDYLDQKPPIFYWQARGHLACPLILGLRPVRYGEAGKEHWAEMIIKGVITALRNGVLYYYYTSTIPASGPGAGEYGPLNHMFPFTPIELHEGWLVGEERIITCVTGSYHWPHKGKPRCLLFDLHGRKKQHAFSIRPSTAGGWDVTIQLNDWNEIAVIEQ